MHAYRDESMVSEGAADCSLNCPDCLAKLERRANELECTGCSKSYPFEDGIADLRLGRKDYYFNPVPRPQMAEIIADVNPRHWARAVRRFIKEVGYNRDWIDNLVVDGRYAWKLFLQMPPGGTVLDLGCGLGNLTKNVAPHVGEVYALDLTWERLQFARKRFGVFNADDRISLVAGGDGKHLPFADGMFDCVMLSGVLEWVPDDDTLWSDAPTKLSRLWKMLQAHFGDTNPRRVQLQFLREIHRVLKPSGQVFVGIENRLDYEYFGGLPDHHSAVRYTSLMPRGLATLYSIAASRRPYRTYTYAYPGYRKLLAEAGFDHAQFLGLTPGYSHLSEVIPFDDEGERWIPRQAANLKERIRTSKLCVPAYGVIGSKAGTATSGLFERIAQDIDSRAGMKSGAFRAVNMNITGRAKAICLGELGDRNVVLRIPLSAPAIEHERANWQALNHVRATGGELSRLTPAPILEGEIQNVRYYVESAAEGTNLLTLMQASGGAVDVASARECLRRLNPDLSRTRTETLEGAAFEREIGVPLEQVGACVEDPGLVAATRQAFEAALSGATVRFGLTHGDYNPENMFAADGRISGIVDWEHWSTNGMPLLDAINFVDGVLRLRDPELSIVHSVKRLVAMDDLPADLRGFLEDCYAETGCESSRHTAFVHLYWLQHVAKQLGELAFDPAGIQSRVRPLFDGMAAQR